MEAAAAPSETFQSLRQQSSEPVTASRTDSAGRPASDGTRPAKSSESAADSSTAAVTPLLWPRRSRNNRPVATSRTCKPNQKRNQYKNNKILSKYNVKTRNLSSIHDRNEFIAPLRILNHEMFPIPHLTAILQTKILVNVSFLFSIW